MAGTLAGKCMYQSAESNELFNQYRGIASEAKIAFFDIGIDDRNEDLAIPFDLSRDIFATAYEGVFPLFIFTYILIVINANYRFQSGCKGA